MPLPRAVAACPAALSRPYTSNRAPELPWPSLTHCPLSLSPLSCPLSRLHADAAMAGSRQSVMQLRPPPAATTSQAMARRSTWLAASLPLTAGTACACRTHLCCRPFSIVAGAGGLEPLLFVVRPFQATSVQAVPLLGCARAPSCPSATSRRRQGLVSTEIGRAELVACSDSRPGTSHEKRKKSRGFSAEP